MERVLCLDLTNSPARALILEYEKVTPKSSTNKLMSRKNATPAAEPHNEENPSEPTTKSTPKVIDALEFDSPLVSNSVVKDILDNQEIKSDHDSVLPLSNLIEFVQRHSSNNENSPFESSLLILPSKDCLSLQIPVPKVDRKQLYRIIEGELLDSLAFDLEDYFFTYRHNSRVTNVENEGVKEVSTALVSLIPKEIIEQALAFCREIGIEPLIATNLAGCLFSYLQNDLSQELDDSTFVAESSSEIAVLVFSQGLLVDEQVIPSTSWDQEVAKTQEIARVITYLNNRNQLNPKKIMLLTETVSKTKLEEIFAVPIVKKESADFMQFSANLLGASAETLKFTNFRDRQYAYTGHWSLLNSMAKSVVPYVLLLLISGLVLVGSLFGLRAYAISQLQDTVRQQISGALGKTSEIGQELNQLQSEIELIEKELTSIGAVSRISSLDTLSVLTQELHQYNLGVRRIAIKGSKVELRATTNSDSPQRLSSTIQRKLPERTINNRKIFCSVKGTVTSGATGGRAGAEINIEVQLCETT